MADSDISQESEFYISPEDSYYCAPFFSISASYPGQPISTLSSHSERSSFSMQPFTDTSPIYIQAFDMADLPNYDYRVNSPLFQGSPESYHSSQDSQFEEPSTRHFLKQGGEEPKVDGSSHRRPRRRCRIRSQRKVSFSLPESPPPASAKSSPPSDYSSFPDHPQSSRACNKHNEIEKKYRANLNGQLEALRLVIMSLPRVDLLDSGLDQRPTKATVIAGARSALLQLQAEKTEATKRLEELRVENLAYRELLSGYSESGYRA